MKPYLLVLSPFMLGASFLASTMAQAVQFPSPVVRDIVDLRCQNDSLNTTKARTRLLWAKNNEIIPNRTFNKWYYTTVEDPDTGLPTVIVDPLPYYPVFGVWDPVEKIVVGGYWKPEANGMPAQVPEPNVWIGACRASCYTPYQQVLTDVGYMEIKDAFDLLHPSVATVDEQSTLESVSINYSEIGKYVISGENSTHEIVTLLTEDGGDIQVTDNHPLLDGKGYMREAKTFAVGDDLVAEDGTKVAITEVENSKYFGRVYNYEPKEESTVANIVIAQGFLNGSARYQSSYKVYMEREVLRSNIDTELLP